MRCFTISKIRQVPDNQEVYIDKDGFTSIIFEICERVGANGSSAEIDGKAMTTHLEELVGDDVDTVKVWNTTDTEFTKLPYVAQYHSSYLRFPPLYSNLRLTLSCPSARTYQPTP